MMARAKDAIFPTLVLYHDDTGDGFGAAWVIHRACRFYSKSQPDFRAVQYGEPIPATSDDDVYLVDFSYPLPQMERLIEQSRSVTVLDHHETARAELQPLFASGRINGRIAHPEEEQAAVGVTWDWFFPGKPLPRLLAYIQDYDLWQFKLPCTEEVLLYVRSCSTTFKQWTAIHYLLEDMSDEQLPTTIFESGRALVRSRQKTVARALETAKSRINISGIDVPVVYTGSNVSQVGNEACKNEPFAVCIFLVVPGDRVVFSLRSDKRGMDVSKVAKRYGGGGHRNAAGFSLPLSEYADLVATSQEG